MSQYSAICYYNILEKVMKRTSIHSILVYDKNVLYTDANLTLKKDVVEPDP